MRWSLCFLAACMPDPSAGIELQGRHVMVHVDPSIPVCADSIAVADRFIEDVAAVLGRSPPTVDYYLMDGDTGCGSGQYAGASCTIDGTVYANIWIQFHELVHAVDDTHPPALFVEGLAEALSTPSTDARKSPLDRKTARVDLESGAFRAGVPGQEYLVAGDFVRYLLERFGAERYREFSRSVLSLSDPISTRLAFGRVFDARLDDVIADWREADAADSTLSVPIDEIDCQDPIPPVGDDRWQVEDLQVEVCRSGTTARGTSYTQRTGRFGFEVRSPGVFLVEAADPLGEQKGAIRSCVAGAQYEYRTSGRARRFMAVPLQAGRHAIDVAETTQAWSVVRLGDAGDRCETAPTFAAPPGESWQLDVRGAPSSWLRITHDGSHALHASAGALSAARACWGACDNLECQSIAYGVRVEPPPGAPLYIVLGATSSPADIVAVKAFEED